MHLGLRKEDLLTLLLRCGYFHCSTEVATLEIAEELYLMPHELMYWPESRLLGSAKPADQLIANIGEPSNCLKIIPSVFIKACLCTICIIWASLCYDIGPFGQAYVLKTLTHQAKQYWTIVLLSI